MLNAAKTASTSSNRNIVQVKERRIAEVLSLRTSTTLRASGQSCTNRIGARFDHCSKASEKPSVGLLSGDLLPHIRTLGETPKSAHQGRQGEIGRDRADLVGYEHLRNNACRKPEERVSTVGAQIKLPK
jgi:hypothetical protein